MMSLPEEIKKSADLARNKLIPAKSNDRYNCAYVTFINWLKENGVEGNYSEEVMLAYMQKMSETLLPTTIWSVYSMLKTCLKVWDNIDIGKYNSIQSFLKAISKGHQPKQATVFQESEISQFLDLAPDSEYLALKAIAIVGILGACRCHEITDMGMHQVKDLNGVFHVVIPKTKNGKMRSFTISGDYYKVLKRYISLRPSGLHTNRLFLLFKNGRCFRQVIGRNTIAKVPKIIAEFLKLENPEKYTGHSFRRSGATFLANAGGDMLAIKRAGGWKSSTCAERYLEESLYTKKKTEALITKRMSNSKEESAGGMNGSQISIALNRNKINVVTDVNRMSGGRNVSGTKPKNFLSEKIVASQGKYSMPGKGKVVDPQGKNAGNNGKSVEKRFFSDFTVDFSNIEIDDDSMDEDVVMADDSIMELDEGVRSVGDQVKYVLGDNLGTGAINRNKKKINLCHTDELENLSEDDEWFRSPVVKENKKKNEREKEVHLIADGVANSSDDDRDLYVTPVVKENKRQGLSSSDDDRDWFVTPEVKENKRQGLSSSDDDRDWFVTPEVKENKRQGLSSSDDDRDWFVTPVVKDNKRQGLSSTVDGRENMSDSDEDWFVTPVIRENINHKRFHLTGGFVEDGLHDDGDSYVSSVLKKKKNQKGVQANGGVNKNLMDLMAPKSGNFQLNLHGCSNFVFRLS